MNWKVPIGVVVGLTLVGLGYMLAVLLETGETETEASPEALVWYFEADWPVFAWDAELNKLPDGTYVVENGMECSDSTVGSSFRMTIRNGAGEIIATSSNDNIGVLAGLDFEYEPTSSLSAFARQVIGANRRDSKCLLEFSVPILAAEPV